MPPRAAIYTRGPTSNPVRAAIYTRVSKDMRDTGRSVGEQEDECRAWADHERWQLVDKEVWSDNDRSASKYAKTTRADWKELVDLIDAGGIDMLVVWEPSRATRDRLVWAALAATCEEHGVRIAASGRVYDLSEPDDAFQLDLFFSLGVRESGITRKRVLRAVKANAMAGRPHGKLLYGYRRRYNETTGALEAQDIHPEQAAIVREMARRVLSGASTYAVSVWLNDQGVTTPKGAAWVPVQVKRVLLNPGYAGKRVYQGKVIGDATWPAILDELTHKMLVAKLTDPARGVRRDSAVKHLLSGIAQCGECGEPVRVAKNRGSISYTCWINAKVPSSGKSFHVSRLVARVDTFVEELLIDRLSRPDALELFARDDAKMDELRHILDLVSAKQAEMETFYVQAREGNLSAIGLAHAEQGLLPEIERLERRGRQIRLVPLLGDLINSDAELVAARWADLEISQKREIIRAVILKIEILRVGIGRRSYSGWESVQVVWRSAENDG